MKAETGRGVVLLAAIALTAASVVVGGASAGSPAPGARAPGERGPASGSAGPDTLLDAGFDLVRNQIVLEVRAGGRGPLRMLLDTAGEPSAVDLTTARENGFPVDTTLSGEASGVGEERTRIFAATLPDVEIAGARLGDLEAVAIDLSGIAARMGGRIDGILGYGLLAGRIVQVDYPARRFRILSDPPPRPAFVVPLRFLEGGHEPVVEVEVAGEGVRVTVDTGSSLEIELFEDVVARLGLTEAVAASDSSSVVGARGAVAVRRVPLPGLRIGPFAVDDVEARVREGSGEDRGGNLGNGILRDFVLTIDYPAGWLGLDRPAAP